MKINFLLTAIITATIFTSCSTSYKTGQTPDDVYYSPVRLQTNDVRREDDNRTVYDNSTVYRTTEDREIRRRVHNRRYRIYYDTYGYDYPYGYNGYNGYPVYGNPKSGTTTNNNPQPRKTNLGAYKPNSTTPDSSNYNIKTGKFNTGTTTTPVRTFGTPNNSSSNNGTGVGNIIRKIFTPDNSNNNYNNGNSNNSSPSRSFDNSSSSSSRTYEPRSSNNNSSTNSNSSTSTPSSSTSAPVRTFKKDN
jgi:hypothetical protein